jgi:UbiD family decarboxylase
MAYGDFRDYLGALEAQGKLRRISKSIDHTWELSCLARWMFQAFADEDRFGMLFEKVKGFDIPVATCTLGASRTIYATALQTEPDQINTKWIEAFLHPVNPTIIELAPCQEVVITSDQVNLKNFPIPIWTPGKDVAPYLTALTVACDKNTGIQNTAIYRAMILDENHLAVNLAPGRHGTMCYESYISQGKPAPFAWVIGAEPAVYIAAVANVPYGIDEITLAGGLIGRPIELVKAKTVDLFVPARAEIVIEGEFRPGKYHQEGPFGEFAGFMGPVGKRPTATITAITHRKDPIYYGILSQMPPSESTVLQSIGNAALIIKKLRHELGHSTVRDAHIDLTYGGLLAHGIISMKPLYPGHAKQVGRLTADMTFLKRVTVVDEDIDIRDPMHLDWAMNARYQPNRDTIIIENVFTPANMDPTIRTEAANLPMGSKLIIDATQKEEPGDTSLPPKDLMMKALELWKKSGLPDFTIPKRTRLLLEIDHRLKKEGQR